MSSYHNGRVTVWQGDCRDVLAGFEPDSFDSACIDPPYHFTSIVKRFGKTSLGDDTQTSARSRGGLDGYARASRGFMGKQWDGGQIAHEPETWAAVLRVLKPGAHLVAFHADKNYHRLVCVIEDAGFEIRHMLLYLYGSGFPKSHDVSKAIDRELGLERTKKRTAMGPTGNKYAKGLGDDRPWMREAAERGFHEHDGNEPVSELAAAFNGWGTALKPSVEPICLARKPLARGKTIAGNVMEYGTGALNIGACRIPTSGEQPTGSGDRRGGNIYAQDEWTRTKMANGGNATPAEGRWPANILHDGSPEVVAGFPESDASSFSGPSARQRNNGLGLGTSDSRLGPSTAPDQYGDSGSAARFFYSVKPDHRCQLCNVNFVETPSRIESTEGGNIAHDGAADLPPQGSENNPNLGSVTAYSAVEPSNQCHPHNGNFAPKVAETWPLEKIVRNVLSAARLCLSCATDIARALVEVRHNGNAVGSPIRCSIGGSKGTILCQSLASYVANRESTDIILTIPSLKELFGSAFHAIDAYINSENHKGNGKSEQCRYWYTSKADADDRIGSKHPTIKPLDLIQWLCRLITPPKGHILDCFAGTGTTAEAALREGFRCTLIEREAEYLADIDRRMALALEGSTGRSVAMAKLKPEGEPLPLFAEAAE